MKIIHTADWHLGHKLHDNSQLEEQSLFLDWLKKTIYEQAVDVLLVSGDIFDTSNPPIEAQNAYYDFLVDITKGDSPCKKIIITGGNHDSPGVLNAPAQFLKRFKVEVIGKATEDIEKEVLSFEINGQKLVVAAVPYLRDKDIRRHTLSERFEDIGGRYKQALIRHYKAVAEVCEKHKTPNTPIIAMGHLFAVGGKTTDSEQTIYVGNLGDIGAEDFPEVFDYIALGHLHRPQTIGGNEKVRYSGSPYKLSFSELGHKNSIELLHVSESGSIQRENIICPAFRKLIRIQGNTETCIQELERLNSENVEALNAWVEIVLEEVKPNLLPLRRVATKLEHLDVLKISLPKRESTESLRALAEQAVQITDLKPAEVFDKLCTDFKISNSDRQKVNDLFYEALNLANEQ